MKALKLLDALRGEIVDLYKNAGVEKSEHDYDDSCESEEEYSEKEEMPEEPMMGGDGAMKGKVVIMKTKIKPPIKSKLAKVLKTMGDEDEEEEEK